ncbi:MULTISPECIES: hypothetical protein [unclassified Streptomyces]|uniref:hypothetical protein n=1 Tax=unclassified Streptomyces TaxID=2593676 RepID=UPI0022B7429C|nr:MULTISPECIES: hypothetical protein [unclassified Streptomyces]MCZ7416494.1 hypothetical protein [Streptomyces sp. WMMC897]MCZ7433695.1 hypothetical protein [Streptomyces sp. WMMC1477]
MNLSLSLAGLRRPRGVWTAVGALALVGVLTGTTLLLSGDDGVTDDGPHLLLPPEAAGPFYRTGDAVLPEGSEGTVAAFGVEDATTVNANYATVDPLEPDVLEDPEARFAIFAGAWGRVADPEAAVDAAFRQLAEDVADSPGSRTTLKGAPERVTPQGAENAVVKCRLAVGANVVTGERQETQFCMWADHSTAGMVVVSRASGRTSTEEGARFAADLRRSARLAVG